MKDSRKKQTEKAVTCLSDDEMKMVSGGVSNNYYTDNRVQDFPDLEFIAPSTGDDYVEINLT